MKKLLMWAAAAGFAAAISAANAQTSSSPSSSLPSNQPTEKSQSSSSSSSPMQSPSSSATTSHDTSSQSATAGKELSGVVKKVDKDKQSLKIESKAGTEQELKVPSSAMITRDGSTAALDQLKEGDEVRASLDPSSNQATKLEVKSKGSMDHSSKSGTSTETKSETKSKY